MVKMTEEAYRRHQERVGRPVATLPSAIRPAAHGATPLQPAAPDQDRDRYSRELALQVRQASLPSPLLEYAFDKQLDGGGRGWRFDLCWPSERAAVEVDGAVHRIKRRFAADIPKSQAALRLGYRVLRVTPADVRSGRALELVRELLAASPDPAPSVDRGASAA